MPHPILHPCQKSTCICKSVLFTITVIDFTGALYVCHNSTEAKVYVCLFTCTTSQAICLEVVTDLSVKTFMLAFRRFTRHRSFPKIVVLHNVSTYMAVAEGLQWLLHSEHMIEVLGRWGVQWCFILNRAPWYGEWWEHLIGLRCHWKRSWQVKSYTIISADSSSRSRDYPQW